LSKQPLDFGRVRGTPLGEYAKKIGVKYLTLYKRVKEGKVKAFRIGSRWMVRDYEAES
jgi:hypothetical protein